ncbi:BGTF surface domain-containing protein [Halosimplex halobium]|uniref:BGTF surface domain-containing protein n=1 Tax=Halosimplex halobium TaxID=3396618 RepID=UPI003F548039
MTGTPSVTAGARGLPARARRGARLALVAVLVATLVTSPLAGVVAAGAPANPSFEETITTVRQGETAEITINATGSDGEGIRFAVGDADAEDQNFEARATVTDADGDGTVVVRFDTAAVDEGGPGSYLTVADGDAIDNRTELAGTDDPLAPAAYDLSLGDPADPAAIGTLALLSADGESAEDDATDGADETATPRPLHDGTSVDTNDDGKVVVDAAPQQTISGETTLDPGTTLAVRVTSSSSSSPFLMQVETTVDDDGTFAASFDFGDVSAGTPFEVTVRSDGEGLAEAYGRVADCEGDCPTATPADAEGSTATPLAADGVGVQGVTQVTSGDVARIPVTFGDADALTVTLGDEAEVNYETTAVIRDTNGDDRAVVVVRTGATDDADRPVLAVAEAGETRPANVTSETTLDSPLDPFDYDVAVSAGAGADGEPDAIGTLVVMADDGAGGSDGDGSTATAADPPAGPDGATVAAAGGSGSLLTGFGALALGGLIAFGGVALFLGFVRG